MARLERTRQQLDTLQRHGAKAEDVMAAVTRIVGGGTAIVGGIILFLDAIRPAKDKQAEA